MSCASCSSRVEKAVSKLENVEKCNVNLLTNSMVVEGSATDEEIIKAVKDAGYGASVKGEEGKQISVCYVISWGNDADYAHTQLAAGCTGFGKEASYFATVTLGDQIVVETEPEVVETVAEDTADATTEAPKTFDAGIIAAVAAIVSAAGYAISKKH